MADEAVVRARAEDLRRWRSEFANTSPIDSLTPRQKSEVVGVVFKIRLDPGRGFEATIEDGTGRLMASWTGRSRLPGVELGAGLRLTGTVATDPDGRLRMRNPEYALVAEPYR
jgi:hypothetical protein